MAQTHPLSIHTLDCLLEIPFALHYVGKKLVLTTCNLLDIVLTDWTNSLDLPAEESLGQLGVLDD